MTHTIYFLWYNLFSINKLGLFMAKSTSGIPPKVGVEDLKKMGLRKAQGYKNKPSKGKSK